MRRGGVAAWNRAHEAVAGLRAESWHRDVAAAAREASQAEFACMMTFASPDLFSHLGAVWPTGYRDLMSRATDEFLPRIVAAGEGFEHAQRCGEIYAPLEVTRHRELAEAFQQRVLSPAGLRAYVCTYFVGRAGAPLALLVLGSERPARSLLERHHGDLDGLRRHGARVLEFALELARRCNELPSAPGVALATGPLTRREQQVADLAAEGYSSCNIAARLDISFNTVGVHLRKVYRKLGVHNRAELTRCMLGGAAARRGPPV